MAAKQKRTLRSHLLEHLHEKTLYANTKYAAMHAGDRAWFHCPLQKKPTGKKNHPQETETWGGRWTVQKVRDEIKHSKG